MKKIAVFLFMLGLLSWPMLVSAAGNGCYFQQAAAEAQQQQHAPYGMPSDLQSADFDNYLRVYYSAGDPLFSETGADQVPDILARNRQVFDRTRHFMETELGWRLPATRMQDGRPVLNVYFVPARKRFTGTVVVGGKSSGQLVFNSTVLQSDDFAALWIHQVAHASQLQYRPDGDYWFNEAVAGWVEGQFEDGYSRAALEAQSWRMQHPEISLIDPAQDSALGASRFIEMLARPDRDLIRQVLEQQGFARDESAVASIAAVLSLNRLPDFDSYLQNYYLLFPASLSLDTGRGDVDLQPYSAGVFQDVPSRSTGGINLSFAPDPGASYSAAILFYGTGGQKSATLAMRKHVSENWSLAIPFAGLDHYRFVVVNSTRQELRGRLEKAYDPTVPGVLEYFHVNTGDGGVQIEWKTSRENGVAFWNLYRQADGKKELLNAFPIPASINSDEGIHYLYVDYTAASFYTLEAVTSEGFQSPLATVESPQ